MTDYRRFAALNGLARNGKLSTSYKKWKAMKEAVLEEDDTMLQGTCGGQLTLAEATEYHRLCRCPPAVAQPMEEDPFDGLPTLVDGLCMEEDSDTQGGDLNLECQPFWDDPMTELLKASVGPTLPDLGELFKKFTLPRTGAIKKQRRTKSSEKACAVSA